MIHLRPGGCASLRSADPAAPDAPPIEPPRGLRVEAGSCDELRLKLLDTWPSDLWHAGRWLLSDGARLYLMDPGAPGKPLAAASVNDVGTFGWEHAPGPLTEPVASIQKLRALSPVLTLRVEQRWWFVRNADDKIVTRLLEHRWASGPRTLALIPLRGYDREAERVRKRLPRGASTEAHPLQLAVEASGYVPRVWNNKPTMGFTRRTTGRGGAVEMLRRLLELSALTEEGILADIDTEFLHDYRVLLRRARAVLSVMKGVLAPDDTAALKDGFRGMAHRTNALRDLDVHLLGRETQIARVPPALRPALEPFFTALQEQRDAEHRALSRVLRSSAYAAERANLADRVAHAEPGPRGGVSLRKLADQRLHKTLQRVLDRGRAITPETPDDDVHELRLDCKKLRYTLELFKELYPPDEVRAIVRRLKKLQDVLGDFNDCSVQKDALLTWVDEHPAVPPRTALALGSLYDALHREQLSLRAQVEGRFAAFDQPRLAAQALALTGRAVRKSS